MHVLIAAVLLLVAPAVAAQDLVVRRADGAEVTVSSSELARLPTRSFEATDHGRVTRFTGIAVGDLLRRVGAGSVDSLRGPALRRVLVAHGRDGYRAVVALAELDVSLGARRAFVVTSSDGAPLAAAEGPYRLVVVGDGRAARWVRQLVRLEVHELP